MSEVHIKHPIHDRNGTVYYLVVSESDTGLCSILTGADGPAGRLNLDCTTPGKCIIANLELFANAPKMPTNGLQRFLRYFNLWKPSTIDYRQRGLGTALIAFVEESARLHHAQSITGDVVRRDYEAWPKLLEWYEKRGYEVIPVPNPGQNHTSIVAYIKKVL